MKEDLAEWLSTLYPELSINADNFMDRLDTGVALCKVSDSKVKIYLEKSSHTPLSLLRRACPKKGFWCGFYDRQLFPSHKAH